MPDRRQASFWPKQRLVSLVLGFALFALVLMLTLGDDVARPQIVPDQDKLEHLVAFLGLGFFFGWGASLAGFVAFALALAAAVFGIEAWQQAFTVSRESSLADALAGICGLMAGLCLAAFLTRASRRRVRSSSGTAQPHPR